MNPILQHINDTIELPDQRHYWVDESDFCASPSLTLKLGQHLTIIRICVEPEDIHAKGELIIYSFNATIPDEFHKPKKLPSRRIHLPLSDPQIFATIQNIINSLEYGVILRAEDFISKEAL